MKRKFEDNLDMNLSDDNLSPRDKLKHYYVILSEFLTSSYNRKNLKIVDLKDLSITMSQLLDETKYHSSYILEYEMLSILDDLTRVKKTNEDLIINSLFLRIPTQLLNRISRHAQGDFSAFAFEVVKNLHELGLLWYHKSSNAFLDRFLEYNVEPESSFINPYNFPNDRLNRIHYLQDLLYLIENRLFVGVTPDTIISLRESLHQSLNELPNQATYDMDVQDAETMEIDATEAISLQPNPIIQNTPMLINTNRSSSSLSQMGSFSTGSYVIPKRLRIVTLSDDESDNEDEAIQPTPSTSAQTPHLSAREKLEKRAQNINIITESLRTGETQILKELLEQLGCPLVPFSARTTPKNQSSQPSPTPVAGQARSVSKMTLSSFFQAPSPKLDNSKAIEIVCSWISEMVKSDESKVTFKTMIQEDRLNFFELLFSVFRKNTAIFKERLGQHKGLSFIILNMPLNPGLPELIQCLKNFNIKISKNTTSFILDSLFERQRLNPDEHDVIKPLYDELHKEAVDYHTIKRSGPHCSKHSKVVNALIEQKRQHDMMIASTSSAMVL